MPKRKSMMTDEEFEDMKRWAEEKMKEMEKADEELVAWYNTMTKEQLRERFIDLDSSTLKWIINDVALIREAYEACAVANDILIERGEEL